MLTNTDWSEEHPDDMPKEFPLSDSVTGDDFEIIGSTEWV